VVFDALKKNSRCHPQNLLMKSTTTGSYLHSVLGLNVPVHCNTSATLKVSDVAYMVYYSDVKQIELNQVSSKIFYEMVYSEN